MGAPPGGLPPPVIDLTLLAGRFAPALAGHLVTAITLYRHFLVKDEQPMPPGLDVLHGQLRTVAASSGQPSARLDAVGDSRGVDATPLLDYPTAAEALGVSERTVRRLVADGALPAVRVGRRVRVHRDDLTTWIDQQRGAA